MGIPFNLVSKVDSVRQVGHIRPTLVKVRSPNTSEHTIHKVKYKKNKPVKQIKDNEDWPESSAGNNMLQKVPTSNSIVLNNRFEPLQNTVNADEQKLTKNLINPLNKKITKS